MDDVGCAIARGGEEKKKSDVFDARTLGKKKMTGNFFQHAYDESDMRAFVIFLSCTRC